MKTVYAVMLAVFVSLFVSACVSRTITTDAPLGKEGKVVNKKLIWIWQDEFRNP